MKRLLLGLATILSLGATSAFATTLTGQYSVADSPVSGGPTISYDLNHTSMSVSLTLGVQTTPTNFFQASPAGSCFGSGCSGNTETDTLTTTFTNLQVLGITIPTFTETATFTAPYSGAEMACADGDGVSPSNGATDCIVWQGAANTYNGSTMVAKNLGNGDSLDIYL